MLKYYNQNQIKCQTFYKLYLKETLKCKKYFDNEKLMWYYDMAKNKTAAKRRSTQVAEGAPLLRE